MSSIASISDTEKVGPMALATLRTNCSSNKRVSVRVKTAARADWGSVIELSSSNVSTRGTITRPSLRPALFDHPADLTNEKRISTGTLPDRLLQPNGDIGMLERRADKLSRVGFVERF